MLTPAVKLPLNQDTKLEEITDTFPFPKHHHAIDSEDTPIASLSLSGEKGEPLYCEKCRTVKPERTHHCRECNRCAPKMDHHCIWINGCVDDKINTAPMLLRNIAQQIGGGITLDFCWKAYKVYLASIYHLWKNVGWMVINRKWIPLLTGVEGLGLSGISFHWYSVTVLGFLFGLTLLGFTGVHFYYTIRNKTSIEHVANRPTYIRADFDRSGGNYEIIQVDSNASLYDQGFYQNWCSVMGSNPFICLYRFEITARAYTYQDTNSSSANVRTLNRKKKTGLVTRAMRLETTKTASLNMDGVPAVLSKKRPLKEHIAAAIDVN
ncbi:protein S-acyltransferase 16-like [Mucor ambiguus]|uniref:Palmitoyltransferase n=1 Tax=Mucor ambiguus TaxID=91626 RepID=A0A0C9M9N3_9FUNG|nr:protein S-acyltransferase 16-like [Mucor ambiguus]